MFDLGDTVPLTVTVKDAAGVNINATTVALAITKPDGTAVTPAPTIVNPPALTGVYLYDYVPDAAGHYSVRWVTTVPSTAFTDVFEVRPALPTFLISLKDAKDHVNITSTTDDEELRGHLASASSVVAKICGPYVEETVVETHWGGQGEVSLNRWPVKSVTSVVPVLTSGVPVDATDIDVDNHGVARSKTGLCFPAGLYRWTFKAGRTAVPEHIGKATAIIMKHLWDTQRGAAPAPFAGGEDQTPGIYLPMMAGTIPPRALELLGVDEQVAGFA